MHRLQRRDYHVRVPNSLWLFDQNHKLRQFGFEIHACIDGNSRKIVWLHVTANNRIPEQVPALYIDAVTRFGCMPARLRSDPAKDNCLDKMRRNSKNPGAVPDFLYTHQELQGAQHCGVDQFRTCFVPIVMLHSVSRRSV